MCSFKLIYFVIFILNISRTHAEISDKRLCVDSECKEPVSLARTLLRYSSPDPRILSFAPNAEATVYSKEAGSETGLWGAEIKGKRGYVPKHLLKEYKIKAKPTLLVDTELKKTPQVPKEAVATEIDPDNTKKPYEVVHGTTIYLNPQDNVNPSTTASPVLSNSLPEVLYSKSEEKSVDTQESVVKNVLSPLTDWINDDSDENDEDVDDIDDEEGDEENDYESQIQDKANIDAKEATPSPTPEGVKISPYGLEINKTVNEVTEASQESVLNNPEQIPMANIEEQTVVNERQSSGENSSPNIKENIFVDNLNKVKVSSVEINDNLVNDTSISKDEPITVTEKNEIDALNSLIQSKESDTISVSNSSLSVDEVPEVKGVKDPTIANSEANAELTAEDIAKKETNGKIVAEAPIEVLNVTEPPNFKNSEENNVLSEDTKDVKVSEEEEKSKEITSSTVSTLIDDAIVPSQEPVAVTEILQSPTTVESPIPPADKGDTIPTESSPQLLFNFAQTLQVTEEVISKENLANETEITELTANQNTSGDSVSSKEEIAEIFSNEEEIMPTEVPSVSEYQTEDSFTFVDIPPTTNVEDSVTDNVEALVEEVSQEVKKETSEGDKIGTNSEEAPPESYEESGGFLSNLFSFFSSKPQEMSRATEKDVNEAIIQEENIWAPQNSEKTEESEKYCTASSEQCYANQAAQEEPLLTNDSNTFDSFDFRFNSDFFLLLLTTAASVIVLMFLYLAMDRHKHSSPLIARINKLEKELLVTLKENEILQEKGALKSQEPANNEIVEELTQKLAAAQFLQQTLEQTVLQLEKELEAKAGLEEQLESLEKELETSTEVGMELNRIISEMLDPTNGSDRLKENVEQLQRQLLEQKDTINNITETLQKREIENRTLRGELEKSNKFVVELQSKLDEMVDKVLRIEREKDQQQDSLQSEISIYQLKYNEAVANGEILSNDIQILKAQLTEVQRQADLKTREYQLLKDGLDKMKSLKNDSEAVKSLLDSASIKAELRQLQNENSTYAAQLQQDQAAKAGLEKKYQAVAEEITALKQNYELAVKERVEAVSKLEVLTNYFKKRETELQEEIIKYKSIWDAKEGEATSTTERIRYMQEEIENYKAQNETLKQEIISQEIDLKSQISILEKKVHENWVTARQTERKLEDAKQEAAQLRNRLTMRERAVNDERLLQNRLQSPVEQNGELPLSPHPVDSPASPPPLLYGARDHIAKSPSIPGLPPFLPPPPGGPFMPPPLPGMPPFMPPPPSMYPGDHRPPPLGRMSSPPPLNSRYSPDMSAFSPYDRRSPSPPYDSEYGTSPPPIRGYSPYNGGRDDRREYKRPPPNVRTNGRNAKGSVMSSGSDHSNDSLNKINRKPSKMV